ncbi:MAG: pyridoxamine 5'-phosphate oxidase family protein [Bacteroidota bacterium]|nr:pyridoxamine 5'-phosphate oxidase family protein [Bacteroidota bacterium]
MIYDTTNIRRQDRLLDEKRALELLRNSEYGVLSLVDEDKTPYGIPLNYVFDEKNSIYIHCAPVGKKLNIIRENNKVSFCIVGKINLVPDKFTTEYESIILEGTAHLNLSEQERKRALVLLVEKLSPQYKEIGLKYIEKSFARTEIIRLDFAKYSGKSKSMH